MFFGLICVVIVMVIVIGFLIKSQTPVQIAPVQVAPVAPVAPVQVAPIALISIESTQVLTPEVPKPVEIGHCRKCVDCFSKQFNSHRAFVVENIGETRNSFNGSRVIRTPEKFFNKYNLNLGPWGGSCSCCQKNIIFLSQSSNNPCWKGEKGYEYLCQCICI